MPQQRERVVQSALCDYLRTDHAGIIFASDTAASLPLTKGLAVLQARHKYPSKGYPDMFIAAKRGKFAGCFLELKAEGERIFLRDGSISTIEHIQRQNETLAQLRNEGYCAEFVIGLEQAKAFVDWYLAGADTTGDLLIQRNADGEFRFTNVETGEVF